MIYVMKSICQITEFTPRLIFCLIGLTTLSVSQNAAFSVDINFLNHAVL
jgi:hypothetical protein